MNDNDSTKWMETGPDGIEFPKPEGDNPAIKAIFHGPDYNDWTVLFDYQDFDDAPEGSEESDWKSLPVLSKIHAIAQVVNPSINEDRLVSCYWTLKEILSYKMPSEFARNVINVMIRRLETTASLEEPK